jgi:hypothetical protein
MALSSMLPLQVGIEFFQLLPIAGHAQGILAHGYKADTAAPGAERTQKIAYFFFMGLQQGQQRPHLDRVEGVMPLIPCFDGDPYHREPIAQVGQLLHRLNARVRFH